MVSSRNPSITTNGSQGFSGALGIDLVEVTDNSDAVVHIRPERLEQLLSTSRILDDVGPRERAR